MESIKDILQRYGFRINSETSEFYKTAAIYRNGTNPTSLSINKNTGYWKDWVTLESGNINSLISKVTGQNIPINIEYQTNKNADLIKEVEIKLNSEEITALLPCYTFYNKRGISNKTLEELSGGMCTTGKMNSRFVFPIVSQKGELVGIAGRDLLISDVRPKWKLLGRKQNWDYPLKINRSIIEDKSEVIILEGISDLVALWDAGIKQCVVAFGTTLSKELLANLIEINPKRILLGMNNDVKDDGTNPGAAGNSKMKEQLSKWFNPNKIEIWSSTKNDFGDLTRSEIRSLAMQHDIKIEEPAGLV